MPKCIIHLKKHAITPLLDEVKTIIRNNNQLQLLKTVLNQLE